MKRPTIGLALGGGGARGVAHIGVLKVLEAHRIPIDYIAGTSVGAIIGGAYALQPNAWRVEQLFRNFLASETYKSSGLDRFVQNEPVENFFGQIARYVRERIVINLAYRRPSIVGSARLQGIIDFVLDDVRIEEALIPMAIVATDIDQGTEVVLRHGSIRQAAMASAAIPGFLPPMPYQETRLVDGAVTSPVPVNAVLAMGADIVIAVDVSQDMELMQKPLSIIDVMFRTNSITTNQLRTMQVERAQVVLRPEVGHVHWADFSDFEAVLESGEGAASEALDRIFKLIDGAQPLWRRVLRRTFSNDRTNGYRPASLRTSDTLAARRVL